jgi:hypothetical protein
MQSERTHAGIPELVAASEIWHRCIRVFKDVGDGLLRLQAMLGDEGSYTIPIDLVHGSDHYDELTEVRPYWKKTPIETLTLALKALGRLKELEMCLRPEMPKKLVEPIEPEKPVEPIEPEAPKQLAEPIEPEMPTQLVKPLEPEKPKQLAEAIEHKGQLQE